MRFCTIPKVLNWENASDHMAQLAVQGPKAILALQKLTSINLSELPYYTFTHGEFAGEKRCDYFNTGYTGAGGFELYFYPEAAMKIWNAVFEAGEEFGRLAGARDTASSGNGLLPVWQ